MIARLSVLLPIKISIPEGEILAPAVYESEFGQLTIHPPVAAITSLTSQLSDPTLPLMNLAEQLARATPQVGTGDVLLNGRKTVLANLLQIEYRRETFIRDAPTEGRTAADDPPLSHAFAVLNGLLRRMRTVGQAARIREIDLTNVLWRFEYLNDDGTSLERDTRYIRVRAGVSVRFEAQALLPSLWERIQALPIDYVPPRWDTLLLDAELMLPEIGPPLVLAFTAVETVASFTIDSFANAAGISPALWKWLNDRGPLKDPTVEEQCGDLLKVFAGRSLKDDVRLWEAFKQLSTARNKFVHEGVATLAGKPVTHDDAVQLVTRAKEIVRFLEQFLPEDARRPIVEERVTWGSQQMLRAPPD